VQLGSSSHGGFSRESNYTKGFIPARGLLPGYEAANQLRTSGYSDGTTPGVAFTYTATGQRATMADGTGTTGYGYDSRDRLIKSVNGSGAAVGYGYDPASNLTVIAHPTAGQSVSRGYDDNVNLTGATYPTTNRVSAALYSHDTANGLSRIVDSRTTGGTAAPFWSYTYTLDGPEQVGAANDPVQPGAVQHTYARNLLDQLTGDTRGGTGSGSNGWGYDSAYRIATRTDTSANTGATYTADNADELTNLVTKVGAATTRNLTLTYNADGARTGQADSVGGTGATCGYDQADRLAGYTSGATTAGYAYDGDGLRAGKTVGGATGQQTWDVAEGLPELLQDGAMRYIYGPSGTPIEQVDASGSVRYYLADHLGSIRGLLDCLRRTYACDHTRSWHSTSPPCRSPTTPVSWPPASGYARATSASVPARLPAWGVLHTTIATAKQLGVNVWAYLHDRVSGNYVLHALADLIRTHTPRRTTRRPRASPRRLTSVASSKYIPCSRTRRNPSSRHALLHHRGRWQRLPVLHGLLDQRLQGSLAPQCRLLVGIPMRDGHVRRLGPLGQRDKIDPVLLRPRDHHRIVR